MRAVPKGLSATTTNRTRRSTTSRLPTSWIKLGAVRRARQRWRQRSQRPPDPFPRRCCLLLLTEKCPHRLPRSGQPGFSVGMNPSSRSGAMRPIGTECSPDKRSAIRENAGHKKPSERRARPVTETLTQTVANAMPSASQAGAAASRYTRQVCRLYRS